MMQLLRYECILVFISMILVVSDAGTTLCLNRVVFRFANRMPYTHKYLLCSPGVTNSNMW
jgi:hypothetical protein